MPTVTVCPPAAARTSGTDARDRPYAILRDRLHPEGTEPQVDEFRRFPRAAERGARGRGWGRSGGVDALNAVPRRDAPSPEAIPALSAGAGIIGVAGCLLAGLARLGPKPHPSGRCPRPGGTGPESVGAARSPRR